MADGGAVSMIEEGVEEEIRQEQEIEETVEEDIGKDFKLGVEETMNQERGEVKEQKRWVDLVAQNRSRIPECELKNVLPVIIEGRRVVRFHSNELKTKVQ
ncbi:hypothetical protein MANES_04G060345v8 [Manihot esculenta]|uniref:Uncharacterized protein n=1 Tax=Manihot esculenta TaxID=3983 RepID=A0ACB7HSL4_MANES|nr:hypothetical protein MANES_04G060345v8 [Manihot esculenta]